MKTAALAAGAALIVAACSSSPAPAAHAVRPVILTTLQACQRLRADMIRNGGTPDRPALTYIADHVNDARLSRDALSSGQAVGQPVAGILLGALAYDCRHAGVQIPG